MVGRPTRGTTCFILMNQVTNHRCHMPSNSVPHSDLCTTRIQETSLKTDRTAKEKQEQPPRLRIISKASTPSARSSTELVLPFTEKDRRHSDIYKASEDSSVNMGMIPGETFDDFDGSAGVKHRRKFSETRNKPR